MVESLNMINLHEDIFRQQPVTLCMLGYTGHGKSTLANEIFGREVFRTDESLNSVTLDVEIQESFIESFGKVVKIVDVPGYGDDGGND